MPDPMHRDQIDHESRDGRPVAGGHYTTAPIDADAETSSKPAPEPPAATFTRLDDRQLVQTRVYAGEGPARWKVRIDFAGDVAGEPVQPGDVLTIGSTIFRALVGHSFEILSEI